MKKVFVCAGMSLAKNEKINQNARELGKLLAQNDCIYCQGGSNDGLMGETLKEFIKYSNNVLFFIPSTYYDYDAEKLTKLLGKENFHAKKVQGEAERLKLITKCEEIIVLPGGTGTIEELLYCNETKRSSEHSSHITLVNTSGYFNGLLEQIKNNIEEGLSKENTIRFDIVESVNEINFAKNINIEKLS